MNRKIHKDIYSGSNTGSVTGSVTGSDEKIDDRLADFLHFKSRILPVFFGITIALIMLSVSAAAFPIKIDAESQQMDSAAKATPTSTPNKTSTITITLPKTAAEVAAVTAKVQSTLNGVTSETKPAALVPSTPVPSSTNSVTTTPVPALQKGDKNELVQLLQERLMELNYLDIDESTRLYGPATEYAVSIFQRQHNLTRDGVAGSTTFDLIFSDAAQKYKLLEGTSGSDVDSLQRQLIDLGYLDKATGYYGTETNAAVRAFQERNGLFVDGKTGEVTLGLIYSPDALVSAAKEQEEIKKATIQAFLETAEQQLEDPYIFGNVGPDSFDCSGLVYYCLKQSGSTRARYNAAGYSKVDDWEKITSMDDLQPGDLLFFSTGGKKVGHTAIYVGNGEMIDASPSNGEVVKRSCVTDYWTNNFVSARRPF